MSILKLIGAVVTAGLSCAAFSVPAVAQGSIERRHEPPLEQGTTTSCDESWIFTGGITTIAIPFTVALPAPVVPPTCATFSQSSSSTHDEKRSSQERPISYGLDIEFRSGHVDRGLVISDRPVVQPVTWMSGRGVTFSVWGNVTLDETTDGGRPQILELELTRAQRWKNLTVEPAVRMFFYRDPVSFGSSRSIEGWLYLTYDAGPFSLVTNHSFDVLTYRGAYFGDAGIEFDRRVSRRIDVGSSLKIGWASSTFNDAYIGVNKSAFNLITVESWLAARVGPHFHLRPFFQFSNIVDRALRAELVRPSVFLAGLATGVEF